jgi:hypothetical protein
LHPTPHGRVSGGGLLMIVVPLEQGTEEWLEYRKKHGMASEAPALTGCALFYPQTPFQLWLVMKRGLSSSPLLGPGS